MDNTINELIKSFFVGDHQFASLNEFKKIISSFPNEDAKKMERFIIKLLSFIKVTSKLPFQLKSNEITIDTFNTFLNLRGLINKSHIDNKESIIFMNSEEKNMEDYAFPVDQCKILMRDEKVNEISYPQYLQKDAHSNFISNCDAKNHYPHPIVIYDHFINIPNFNFSSYSENRSNKKINYYHSLFWIMKLFLNGSVNNCKIAGKTSNFLNNLLYFLEEGLKTMDPFFEVIIRSTDFYYFLYDHLFTQYCQNEKSKTYITKFQFVDFLPNDPSFKDLCHEYPSICEIMKDSYPYPYDLVSYQLREDEIQKVNIDDLIRIDLFKEIPVIEEAIKPYEEWKKQNLDILSEGKLFELIRSKLFQRDDSIENFDDKFGQWFLNPGVSLINREVYSTFKSIHNGDRKEIEFQLKILKGILNPWSDDDRVFNYFIHHFVKSRASFESLNEKVENGFSFLINMFKHCKPFYITSRQEVRRFGSNEDSEPVNTYILFESLDVRTYYVERLLYCNSLFPQNSFSLGRNGYRQIFDFFTNLPFVHKTTDLVYLALFANELIGLFRDQLNLSFIFLTSSEKCVDLIDVNRFPPIEKVVCEFKKWGCLNELSEALKSADVYNKGRNSDEKLRSYINRLIEINNKTVLDRKNHPDKIHFRLFSLCNTHANVSLMNTFVPALSHLDTKTPDRHKLISAYYLLTKSNSEVIDQRKISTDKESTMCSKLPAVFNFKSDSANNFAKTVLVHVLPIPENCIFLGFDQNKMALSLCNELREHLSSNRDSYRSLVWSQIKESADDGREDRKGQLNTLMALFEVYDENGNHQFFNTNGWKDGETPPERVGGAKLAFDFLNNYLIISND